MQELEALWTAIEAEVPGSKNFHEPHLGEVAGKRKREPDREEVDNLDELIVKLTEELAKLELDNKIKSNFKYKLDPPKRVGNEAGDGTSMRKPAASPVTDIIKKF